MSIKKLGNIEVSMEVLEFYDVIHQGKQKADDTSYKRKVLSHYQKIIDNALSEYALDFKCELNEISEIDTAFDNFNSIFELISLLDDYIDKGADFTKYPTQKIDNLNLCSDEFQNWVTKSLKLVRGLPLGRCAINKKFHDSPLHLITHSYKHEYELSDEEKMMIYLKIHEPHANENEDYRINLENTFPAPGYKSDIEKLPTNVRRQIDNIIGIEMNGAKKKDLANEAEAAYKIAKSLISNNPSLKYSSTDDIIAAYREYVNKTMKDSYKVIRKIHRKRNIHLLISFIIWFVIALSITLTLVILKPYAIGDLELSPFRDNGWHNVWMTLASFVEFAVLCFLAGSGILLIDYFETISDSFKAHQRAIPFRFPIIPKFVLTGIIIYFTIFTFKDTSYGSAFDSYQYVTYVFGGWCALTSLIYDLHDLIVCEKFHNENLVRYSFANKFKTNQRGLTLFTSWMAILPFFTFFAGILSAYYLNIVAYSITLGCAVIAMGICSIYYYVKGDSRYGR